MQKEHYPLITCKNCNNSFTGKYCNQCSQSAHTDRITWKEILHHLPHAIFHADKGLLYTAKEMTLRPGYAIKEYLEGKRISHANPFLFVILTAGFAIFLFMAIHLKLLNKEIELEAVESFNATLAHYFFLIPGLILLILFSFSDFFLYRKYNYAFPELIVFNAYCFGQIMVFVIALVPLLYLQYIIDLNYGIHITLRPIIKVGMMAYLFFVRYQFYQAKHNYLLLLKIALQIMLIYMLYEFVIAKLSVQVFA